MFDRVIVVRGDGTEQPYSADEFLALPLHERVKHILGREIRFFMGERPVDRAVALRSLRD